MKTRHSESLVLIWRVAEFEARQLKALTLEPTHLFLGLCKSIDLDLPALVPKDSPERDDILEELLREVRRLRNVFKAAGLDARKFRRQLRTKSGGNRFSPAESERLRRSSAAKQVFADAEHFAAIADCTVFPADLLYAVLLADDEKRDALMAELDIDKKRLQQVAKREVLFGHDAGNAPADDTRTKLN